LCYRIDVIRNGQTQFQQVPFEIKSPASNLSILIGNPRSAKILGKLLTTISNRFLPFQRSGVEQFVDMVQGNWDNSDGVEIIEKMLPVMKTNIIYIYIFHIF
jgi:hypothetical protein